MILSCLRNVRSDLKKQAGLGSTYSGSIFTDSEGALKRGLF